MGDTQQQYTAGEVGLLRAKLKEAKAELQAFAELEQKVSASVPGLAFFYDTNSESMVHVLGNVEGTLGYTGDELMQMGSEVRDKVFAPQDRARLLAESDEFRESANDQCIVSTEARFRKKDGEIRWMLFSRSVSARNDDGTVAQVVGSLSDITLQKQAERELRLTRISVEKSRDSIFWVRPDGSFHWANESASRTLGYSHEDLLRIGVPEIDVHVSKEKWQAEWHQFLSGQLRQFETVCCRADGSTFPAEVSATLVEFEGEQFVFAFMRDISVRKEAENRLKEAIEKNKLLQQQLEAENVFLREEIRSSHFHAGIVGSSDVMKDVMRQAEQVARTDSTVFLRGETGTGKELMARAIHEKSRRSEGPFVVVNCALFPEDSLDVELFGQEKDLRTGSSSRQIGRIEAATGGTLFLDEVSELSEPVQSKLLRLLTQKQLTRVGGMVSIQVDVRVIAASNRDLAVEVANEKFRSDLFYHLDVFPITMPPLRLRKGDIAALAWRFVSDFSEKMNRPIEGISKRSLDDVEEYPWPGNVRELRNVIERSMIRATDATLTIEVPELLVAADSSDEIQKLADHERDYIISVLSRLAWKVRGKDGAAAALDLPPTTLESRMKKLGIKRPARKPKP